MTSRLRNGPSYHAFPISFTFAIQFLDAALPFGLRSAPKLFNALADALLWVASQQGARQLYHYLDDFIVLGPPGSTECASSLHALEKSCALLGVPIAHEKTVAPTTCLVFLGIEIDTSVMQARLPRDKLASVATLVNQWRQKRACRKKELQSLAGHLCYAAKVVRPGRRFLREMFALLAKFKNDYFFIRLNHQIRADLEWWRMFIHHWNGVSLLQPHEYTW